MTPHETSMGEKIDKLTERFNSLEVSLKPIVEAYNSVIFGKKVLIGFAGIVAALAVIGGGILWLLDRIRHG